MFRILAIDGGGIRGIFPAHFLSRLEEEYGSPIGSKFDLIVGTSTGAIIAAATAMHVDMRGVVRAYEEHAPKIFKKKRWPFAGYLFSKYSAAPLKMLLNELFGSATMAAAKQRLVIPATDVSNGNVFVIKSQYLATFVRDKNFLIADAVLASCAAPSYFDPVRVGEYLLADGGLWANNPSFVAYTEAVGKLRVDAQQIRVLSIGTGMGHQCYDLGRSKRNWGLVTGWQGSRLVDAAMNIQGRASSNVAALLLGNNYLRIGFDETGNLPLDDIACLPRLKSKAGEAFTYRHEEVARFLEI